MSSLAGDVTGSQKPHVPNLADSQSAFTLYRIRHVRNLELYIEYTYRSQPALVTSPVTPVASDRGHHRSTRLVARGDAHLGRLPGSPPELSELEAPARLARQMRRPRRPGLSEGPWHLEPSHGCFE